MNTGLSFLSICTLLATAPLSFAQAADELPDLPAALLEAAYETGDPDQISAVADAVRKVFPDYEEAIAASANEAIAALPAPDEAASDDADDTAEPTDVPDSGGFFALSPWEGKAVASAAFASGNSENTAVGVALEASRQTGAFSHTIGGYFDLASNDGVRSQQRWGATYQLDYAITDRTYAYGRIAYDEDAFSGFDYRLFAGAGLGHFLFKSDPLTWKVEGGPGYRYSPIDDTREIDQNFAFYAASETDWLLREGVLFEQDFEATWTEPTTTLSSTTALKTALTDSISTGVSFQYRYETNPPPGKVKSDTLLRANLSYGF